ncbi:glycosyltransferase [Aquabacterium fontiphilum]|uniref:glycosyltransferase family 2 protein n=1 Tax=Aquabacterium fontiphilum TaxID=450365 RepID=UPI0013775E76|nr:glycosyltransferase family 2 protein [Aquabacterium fontiphilum]NBD19562.1 glycosyltransferase [Aquabacterium fontiphilum]
MRCVCVINNFNYAKYLPECLDSVRQQSRPFDRVLLVDDGSTDESLNISRAYAQHWPEMKIISKPNGGQLSCFNAVVPYIDKDDLVCLLDADDVYPPDYLACLTEEVNAEPADFYFCEPHKFDTVQSPLTTAKATASNTPNFTWQVSSYATRMWQLWIGSPTSCVSVRGKLYLDLLPYPHEAEWRTRADDILVWGASLIGASKRHLLDLRVGYRMHQSNAFAGRVFSDAYEIRRAMHVDRLFNHYCSSFQLSRRPPTLKDWARREAYLVPEHLWKRYRLPSKRKLYLAKYRGLRKQIKKLRWMLRGGK